MSSEESGPSHWLGPDLFVRLAGMRLSAQRALKPTVQMADLCLSRAQRFCFEGTGMKASDDPLDDRGFTLIELLVVIIIISILAAISVTNFLGQRSKGFDTQARSDLHNAMTSMETYLADDTSTSYPATDSLTSAVLAPLGLRRSSAVSDIRIVVTGPAGTQSYKLSAFSQSGQQWCASSAAGGVISRGAITNATVATPPSSAETASCP
jgi:prepilin-type N-terminal cleavage/methylation domain-containing protein